MPTTHSSSSDFIRLLTDHQLPIKGLILSMAPGCQDVNDILQDINVVLWEKMSSYTAGTDFKAWAYAISRIKVMQYWDTQRKLGKITLSNDFLEAVAEARKDDSSSFLQDKLATLNRCLGSLKPKEQQLVHARYSETITLESYASQQGSTAGTMKVSLHRIKKKLKICMEKNSPLNANQY